VFLGFQQPAAAWSVLRGLRRNTDHKTHIELITLNDWAQCYEKVLNEDREEFKDDNEFNHGNLGFEISEEEVKRELEAGKNGKAAGPGSVHLEILKYGGNKIIILIITKLCRKILQGVKMPEEMKFGNISSIHKKGDRRSCSNYRGICVINPILKTFGRLIKYRLEEEYVSLEEQCGFTTGRSCIDHIFTLRQILE
jgi:hypothetical protein